MNELFTFHVHLYATRVEPFVTYKWVTVGVTDDNLVSFWG